MTEYTIGFSPEERLELLEIFKDNPKWSNRIKNSFGFKYTEPKNYTYSNFKSSFEKLPEKLDIGKKIEVIKDSFLGKSGIIQKHYINGDDCGDLGKAYYEFHAIDNSGIYSVRTENCKLID